MEYFLRKKRKLLVTIALFFLFLGGVFFNFNFGLDNQVSACQALENTSEKSVCLENFFKETVKEKETKKALETLVALSQNDESFNADCHAYAHVIGEASYVSFAERKGLSLSQQVTSCGYGFFHGFMEALLFDTGSISYAREFCSQLDSYLSNDSSSNSSTACFHGIGHGFLDGNDPRFWGDPDRMVETPLRICDDVSVSMLEKYLCTSGVFNSLEILSVEDKYNLDELREDPYMFCQRQRIDHRDSCYTNMIPAVLRITNDNVSEALSYMLDSMGSEHTPSIDGYTSEEAAVLSLMAEFMRLNIPKDNYPDEGVAICRSLSEYLQKSCIEGLSFGHMKYGIPQKMEDKFLLFCSRDDLTQTEKGYCYGFVLKRIDAWLEKEQILHVCNRVPDGIRDMYCKEVI